MVKKIYSSKLRSTQQMTVEVVGFPDLNTSGIMRTTTYTDIDEFLNAVKEARKGDQIILANGNHKLTRRPKPFSKKGTDKNPIIVRAENVGGATLKGKTGLKFKNCDISHGMDSITNKIRPQERIVISPLKVARIIDSQGVKLI